MTTVTDTRADTIIHNTEEIASAGAAPSRLSRLLRSLATRTVAVAALLALWETLPRLGAVDRTFLPPFSAVWQALLELAADGQLATNIEASLTRSLSGFTLAVAISVPLGLLIGWYKPLSDVLNPLLQIFLNTAALALLPVFVLILGIGETSKIAIVLYACTWPILLNTISAVRNVDPTLLRLAKSMNLPPVRLFQKVILPASVPTIFTGIRLAGAVAIVVVVAAEMVGAKAGLGYLINASQYNFAIPQMYAGIVTISVIGVVFNQLLVVLERGRRHPDRTPDAGVPGPRRRVQDRVDRQVALRVPAVVQWWPRLLLQALPPGARTTR